MTRRESIALLVAGSATLLGCPQNYDDGGNGTSRLTARPSGTGSGTATGTIALGLASGRDGYLFVPSPLPSGPLTLMLALHGAGGNAQQILGTLQADAQRLGFAILAVDSRESTWDTSYGPYGVDVRFIDKALKWVFDRYPITPSRVGIAGFSDGASYSLGVGLTNGDLFTHTIAFSPGYIPISDTPYTGKPKVYMSHGTQDTVLPIDKASRAILPYLQTRQYDVTLTEFVGGHTVPADIATAATTWFMST